MGFIRRLKVTQRLMEKALLGVSLYNPFRNQEIEQPESGEPNDIQNSDHALVNAALVGPQQYGQTSSTESPGAAGKKLSRTMDFRPP
ncbi:jg8910 [Pararge aegeria aegeria]|uniref:Jg8910 protein n=1 Tax=Pararge aegeria aegeria TaxID=348720 RepID=A0A8S4SJK4_9NEOP|nr:jg8910 [Pararge aegeria aegeria]